MTDGQIDVDPSDSTRAPTPSPIPRPLSRRALLRVPAAVGLGALAGGLAGERPRPRAAGAAPTFQRSAATRPGFPSGIASGDATDDSAIIWSRTDRAARVYVEWSTTSSFANPRRVRGPLALPTTDYTARIDLRELPANQDIFYRVTFVDVADTENVSEPQSGHLRTAPGAARRDISFAWGGDTAGQGWGIYPDWGGMRIYETMRRMQPDFFIHSGDNIYADGPIVPRVNLSSEITLADGRTSRVWRNLTLPGIEKVAETLEEYRTRYRYNALDANWRRFHADTPAWIQWDDHEVTNNWWPGLLLSEEVAFNRGYTERRIDVLTANATAAFFEYSPIRPTPSEPERVYRSFRYGPDLEVFIVDERSYRGRNTRNLQPAPDADTVFLGRAQMDWLKNGLRQSRATWKIIASDMPVGLFVADTFGSEAWANDDPGPPAGRELELAEILTFLRENALQNVVWITADVHYAASHLYEPSTGVFRDFTPFYEFVSGPLHAGTFGPNRTDATFGPRVLFNSVPDDQAPNESPALGKQFFSMGRINAATRALTIEHYNLAGDKVWSIDLDPRRGHDGTEPAGHR